MKFFTKNFMFSLVNICGKTNITHTQKRTPTFDLINMVCIPLSCSNITITIYCNVNKCVLQAFHMGGGRGRLLCVQNTQFIHIVKTAAGFGIISISWLFYDKTTFIICLACTRQSFPVNH